MGFSQSGLKLSNLKLSNLECLDTEFNVRSMIIMILLNYFSIVFKSCVFARHRDRLDVFIV